MAKKKTSKAAKPAIKSLKKAVKKKVVAKKAAPKKAAPALKKIAKAPATLKAKKSPVKAKAPVPKAKTAKAPVVKKAVKPAAPKKKVDAAQAEFTRIEVLRRLLIQRREGILREAQSEIAKYIKGENRQLVETALDDGDWSVIDLSEDINLRKLNSHRQTLQKIDEAIRKINEGTYGICEDCGDHIAAERLRILPFAIYCRDCQEKREELEATEREATL